MYGVGTNTRWIVLVATGEERVAEVVADCAVPAVGEGA